MTQTGTTLIGWRKATKQEAKERGAEVVFTREDADGNKHIIYGCVCYESWEQWGARREILADNVADIEAWRQRLEDAR